VATSETGKAADVASTTEFLRNLAKSAGLDFFDHSFELPKTSPAAGSVPGPDMAAALSVADPSMHFRMPTPRWGINE
jgi:hypothetical protein